jgi:hypothetical protein
VTTTTTRSDVRSPLNGRVPDLDSPAVRQRARANVPVADSNRNKSARVVSAGLLRRWWGWTARPLSLRATWAQSAVDSTRIPLNNTALRLLWQASNFTDRLVMFALILIVPTALTGPLRWCAVRPTRRWALYLTLTALAGAYLIGRKY